MVCGGGLGLFAMVQPSGCKVAGASAVGGGGGGGLHLQDVAGLLLLPIVVQGSVQRRIVAHWRSGQEE